MGNSYLLLGNGFSIDIIKKLNKDRVINAIPPYVKLETSLMSYAFLYDIHTLFDIGHLRIPPEGIIELSSRARMDYKMDLRTEGYYERTKENGVITIIRK